MKIIDAHVHFFQPDERFAAIAQRAGHLPTAAHLAEAFAKNGVALGIGMGTVGKEDNQTVAKPLTLAFPDGEEPLFLAYCLGIDTAALTPENREASLRAFEARLQRPRAVGLKVYAGYQPYYVNDPVYHPFYELAEAYGVPVVIHTGDTANPQGRLRYSHPLTVDEVAVNFPRVQFVMAHYGNPWIIDATEVAKKNPNVCIDLSGLAEGCFAPADFCETYRGYLEVLRTWMTYLGDYSKLLYGSDWPLVHLADYIALIERVIPEAQRAAVFYENALRVFPKIVPLLDSGAQRKGETR